MPGELKTDEPWGGAILGPGVMVLTNLVESHMVMLHTKYQSSRLCGFREDFLRFSYISLCKTDMPRGWDHSWPGGHNLNNRGRHQLGDTTYKILKV